MSALCVILNADYKAAVLRVKPANCEQSFPNFEYLGEFMIAIVGWLL